jgi:branched-subunit amino acid ABC-type transport system permease component
MGWFLILPMFAAVILGGIGNPYVSDCWGFNYWCCPRN